MSSVACAALASDFIVLKAVVTLWTSDPLAEAAPLSDLITFSAAKVSKLPVK